MQSFFAGTPDDARGASSRISTVLTEG